MFTTRAPALAATPRSHLVPIPDWPRLPAHYRLDRVAGVAQDSRGFFYALHRGEHPLLRINPDGTLHAAVGEEVHRKTKVFMMKKGTIPDETEELHFMHGLHVDPWDNVWVTDVGRQLVMRFDPEGRLTMTLGVDGEAGTDERHFNQPTAVCVVPSGEIFVTDGYGNSRVIKYAPDGTFLKAWGQRGTEPGQFHSPHAIVAGRNGWLYVSDRENDRIQLFDQEGELIAIWTGLYSVDGLCLAPDGTFYGSSGSANTVIEFDHGGGARQVWVEPGLMDYPHGIWVDREGLIHLSETGEGPMGDRLLRFRRSQEG